MNVVVLVICLLICPAMSLAQGSSDYRLVHGDRLEIIHPAADSPVSQSVDLDGNLRLADVGVIRVVGKTITEASASLRGHIDQNGHFVDPKVTLSVAGYAPIVVAGEVSNPGQIDFYPGLTVATAIALTKGVQPEGLKPFDLSRTRVALRGQVAVLDLEIAAEREKLITLRSRLKADVVTGQMTADADPSLVSILDQETLLSVRAWSDEAAAIRQQIALLKERIEVEEAKAQLAANDLAAAQSLRAKGLQTTERLSNLTRRDADARSEVLALESAVTRAAIALIQIEARRDQYLSKRKATLLQDIQAAEQRILSAELRRESTIAQLNIVARAGQSIAMSEQAARLRFKILTMRADQSRLNDVGLETRLLPGDTLLVEIANQGNG